MIGNLNRQKEDERKSRHIFFRGFIAVVFLIILLILPPLWSESEFKSESCESYVLGG